MKKARWESEPFAAGNRRSRLARPDGTNFLRG